jgi:hypothetical protein
LQIDPFEAGFECDECRHLQNGRAGPIVTACAKYFPAPGVFETFSGEKNIGFGLHSAESCGKCAPQHPGTLPKFNPNYQTLNHERSD